MIQDIYPHQFLLDYKIQAPVPGDALLLFHRQQIFLNEAGAYPHYEELNFANVNVHFLFLFAIDRQNYFLADFSEKEADTFYSLQEQKKLLCPHSVRCLRDLRPMDLAFAGYTAWHLHNWYQSNRFCGHCGAKTLLGTNERKLVCPSCHAEIFPRINPCIIVAVHDGDRLLMTKYAGRPVGWFVLIAGFIEIGETAEDTVHREVMEETGVRVKNIRYFGSQPWGIPGNLTLGFTAELEGSDEITLDTGELAAGRWFLREEVPVPDDDVSITSAMIHAFVNHEF